MRSLSQIAIFLCFLLHVNGFTVTQPMTISSKSVSAKNFRVVTRMSDDAAAEAEKLRAKAQALKEEVATLSGTTVEEMEKKEADAAVPEKKSGDLYDDEVAAYKDPLSDNMRARLMAEASTGLDSEKKQTNVILYISIAVAILVLLGGEGILY
mmetsp:Transcript_19730/g.24887  ORF Transcript_19730/g.24887 Transcript_19730/m.24887 type:complete len:153 (-) Transcript_19730:306-764(-)